MIGTDLRALIFGICQVIKNLKIFLGYNFRACESLDVTWTMRKTDNQRFWPCRQTQRSLANLKVSWLKNKKLISKVKVKLACFDAQKSIK